MRKFLLFFSVFIFSLTSRPSFTQNGLLTTSLCDLQKQVLQGEYRNVRVEGVYMAGFGSAYIVAPECSKISARIEFELKTRRNDEDMSNQKPDRSLEDGSE